MAAIGSLGALSVTSVPTLDAWWDTQHIRVVQGPGAATLRLVPGSTLSLLALHGPCTHVTLRGTRWELDRVDLEPMVGLGVSNEVPAADGPDGPAEGPDDGPVEVEVSLSTGTLTIFDVPATETAL
jgi:thiamine pyrophosphokinase